MAKNCWELRGCYQDEEMNGRCPHNIPGEPCPADCKFTACDRPSHVVVRDILMILDPDLKIDAACKEVCRMGENFINNGPRYEEGEEHTTVRQGNPSRFIL